jgi:hypothetical protein
MFLVWEGHWATTMIHDATDNAIHSIANNWFTACRSVLDIAEDTVLDEDKTALRGQRQRHTWFPRCNLDDAGPSMSSIQWTTKN